MIQKGAVARLARKSGRGPRMSSINIAAITKSIVNKVRYTVETTTGLEVKRVNVYVDGMKA